MKQKCKLCKEERTGQYMKIFGFCFTCMTMESRKCNEMIKQEKLEERSNHYEENNNEKILSLNSRKTS